MKFYSFTLSIPAITYIILWFYYLFDSIIPFMQTNIFNLAQVQLGTIIGTTIMLSVGVFVVGVSIIWIFICWTE